MSSGMPAVLAMLGGGRLPFSLLHRRPLYLHALEALAASGAAEIVVAVDEPELPRVAREVGRAGLRAEVVAGDAWWGRVRDASTGLLVHDALCPLTSAEFLRDVRRDAAARPLVSRVAYRPVTDTVKTVVAERIQGTIDREGLAALVSPVVVSPGVLTAAAASGDAPPIHDFSRLVAWLRDRGEVELVRAPSLARRVDDASAVNLLECVDELARRVRRGAGAPQVVTDAAGLGTP